MSSAKLDQGLIRRARKHEMSPDELREQEVSFLRGCAGSTLTRDEIDAELRKEGMLPPEPSSK